MWRYIFDVVFNDMVMNVEVYDVIGCGLILGVVNGMNLIVFVYGVMGLGKMYTMIGNYDESGMMFFLFVDIFD